MSEATHAHPPTNRSLSAREEQVLELVALGLTNQQIAIRLHVTVHAVKFHLAGVYRKLGVTNRTEAVVRLLSGRGPAPAAIEETA
jgi:LuxR family transcriptional regulator, maltose regulon positive regulatory protein